MNEKQKHVMLSPQDEPAIVAERLADGTMFFRWNPGASQGIEWIVGETYITRDGEEATCVAYDQTLDDLSYPVEMKRSLGCDTYSCTEDGNFWSFSKDHKLDIVARKVAQPKKEKRSSPLVINGNNELIDRKIKLGPVTGLTDFIARHTQECVVIDDLTPDNRRPRTDLRTAAQRREDEARANLLAYRRGDPVDWQEIVAMRDGEL